MKKRFSQRIFGRQQGDGSPDSRSLARRFSFETLENRELLNADWGGFSNEILNEYVAEAADYSVELSDETIDRCAFNDMNGSGVDELLAVNYSSKTLSVYEKDDSGKYSLVKSAQIAELGGSDYSSTTFGDVDGDGVADLVVVSQDYAELSLSATVYKGSASFNFTKGATTKLDVSKFTDGFLFFSLDVALLPNATNGCDLVVQGSTISTTTSPRQTVLYPGVGTTNFGKTGRLLNISGSATINDPVLADSALIDGKNYLVSINKTASATQRSNQIVLTDVATKTNYQFALPTDSGAFVAEWVLAQNGTLVVGGTRGGVSGILSMKIASLTEGKFNSSWTECDGLTVNAASCAAIGNMDGLRSSPELFVVNAQKYAAFTGTESQESGYRFEQSGLVVASPNYRAVEIGDYDGDGQKEALLVGDSYIWAADGADDGTIGAPIAVCAFDRLVKDAVFGDFNGDGKTDVAVYYQATGADSAVGTNLQVFQQTANGGFVPIASYGVASHFVDFATGRFTQTDADEIAVLYQTTNGSQYVAALKLVVSTSSTTLTAARTYRAGSVGATTLTVGKLYDSAVDDVVLVCSDQDNIVALKNLGSTFSATSLSTNAGLSSVANPTAVQIGDVDGDGKKDLVVLNSASGSNRGHVAYLLQTTTGFAAAKSNASLRVNGDSPRELALADLDGDGKLDVATIQATTDGKFYLYRFLNDGSAAIFSSGVRSTQTTVVGDAAPAFALATINDDASFDVAIASGKKLGVYLNSGSEGGATGGSVAFACQSASSGIGATFEQAGETARTWLDEWSNFSVDVWASADGAAVASVSAAFQFDPRYFVVSGVEATTGFSVSNVVENGVVSIAATAKSGTTATGNVAVARIRFEPVSATVSGKKQYVGGVDEPADGVLKSVAIGFGAVPVAQKVNGAVVASVSAPNVELYPVAWDFNNDGTINTSDFEEFLAYFDVRTSEIPQKAAKYRIFDANNDGTINTSDFEIFVSYFDVGANNTADSFYREKPIVSTSNAVDASSVAFGVDEFELVDPSAVVAANASRRENAVDVAMNAWAVDGASETPETFPVAEIAAEIANKIVADDAVFGPFVDDDRRFDFGGDAIDDSLEIDWRRYTIDR